MKTTRPLAGGTDALELDLLRCATEASLATLRQAVEHGLGPADIVLSCAGITRRAPTLTMETAEWQRIVDVNLMGTLRTYKAFAGGMIERGRGWRT